MSYKGERETCTCIHTSAHRESVTERKRGSARIDGEKATGWQGKKNTSPDSNRLQLGQLKYSFYNGTLSLSWPIRFRSKLAEPAGEVVHLGTTTFGLELEISKLALPLNDRLIQRQRIFN